MAGCASWKTRCAGTGCGELVPNRLRNAVEQAGRWDAERVGQLDDRAETRLAGCAFQARYLRGVQIAGMAQGFLGQLHALALATHVAAKNLLGLGHAADRRRYSAKSSRAKTSSFR
jgi:hypothetical protein